MVEIAGGKATDAHQKVWENNTNRIASAQVLFYRMINRMVEFEECLQANNSKTVELYFTVNQLLI